MTYFQFHTYKSHAPVTVVHLFILYHSTRNQERKSHFVEGIVVFQKYVPHTFCQLNGSN